MDGNKRLSEILGFYKYKVDNGLCTMQEMNDTLKVLEDNMNINGTISDFAKFVKDYIDDPDGSPTRAFDEFYAKTMALGIPIVWEDVL